jgi:hypothetical protein
MTRRLSPCSAIVLGSLAFPLTAAAEGPPRCADLAAMILSDQGNDELFATHFPGKGVNAGPRSRVLAATSAVIPAGVDPGGPFPAYCEVNLKQFPAINIRVGLPLSGADGGSSVDGAWNGKLQNLGGGGFVGSVGNVRAPVAAGYVGSSTDAGHNEAWCAGNSNHVGLNTPGPKPVPFGTGQCGLGGGAFVLDQGTPPRLITSQVKDFIADGILAQTLWAKRLAKLYYTGPVQRNGTTGTAARPAAGKASSWRRATATCSTASWSAPRP